MMAKCGVVDVYVGARVEHVFDPGWVGTVRVKAGNGLWVLVEWDDCPGVLDFQWVNKVKTVEA